MTGAQGPAGAVYRWTSYRAFWFDSDTTNLRSSDMSQVAEIAEYMKQNPSLKIGIDGSSPSGANRRARDLADRRSTAVRNALIDAGVPGSRIEMGAFGDRHLVREGRVEVLLHTR